jgi:UDP-glucuronate 4-epimerase
MKILVTGSAGFIGFHVVKQLISMGHDVIGVDNLNDYYDVQLKLDRLRNTGIDTHDISFNKPLKSKTTKNYQFVQTNIEDIEQLKHLFIDQQIDSVCHLAAQAGVRYSLENPHAYISSNIQGFLNILELCRHHHVKHLVYASSSSIYGNNEKVPFSTTDNTDHPISLYAATKKSNELMAHTYSHLYGLKTTGLRFFTVYGPWGRPDMAYFKFVKSIINDQPIQVYNHGHLSRDFTYIDDIVKGVTNILSSQNNIASNYQLYNIGHHEPVFLLDFISTIENILGKTAIKEFLPMQDGDVLTTYADIEPLQQVFNFIPSTGIEEGLSKFIEWYKNYYHA